MFRFLRAAAILIVCWFSPVPDAYSAATDAWVLFKAGIQAFKQGDLIKAQNDLESAANQGLNSKALTYNLGVVYYRLKLYDKADATFRRLIDSEQKALAHYNIGLVALARQDKQAAARAFQQVLAADADQKLDSLATTQLERLDVVAVKVRRPKRWAGLASVGAGYEDNIALFPDSASTAIEGAFVETIGAVSGLIHGDNRAGLRSDLKLYSRHYPSNNEFDSQIVQADTGWMQQTAPGQIRVGLGGDYIWRGGKAREGRARLVIGLKRRQCMGLVTKARCSFRGEVMQVFPQPEFDAYRGQRYRFDARYLATSSDWTGALGYRVDYNDRDNFDTEREYFSVSPLRQGLEATVGYAVTPRLALEAEAGYRFSYYRTPHRLQVSDGLLIIRREDSRYRLSLGASYAVSKKVSVTLEANHTDNDSNIDRYEYNRRTVTAGVAARF